MTFDSESIDRIAGVVIIGVPLAASCWLAVDYCFSKSFRKLADSLYDNFRPDQLTKFEESNRHILNGTSIGPFTKSAKKYFREKILQEN